MEKMNRSVFANENEGGTAMIIFDFNQPRNDHPCITIDEDIVRCIAHKLEYVKFCNYPILRIDDLPVENCVFENCETVYFADCQVTNTIFDGVETLYADRSDISACDFYNLRCDRDCILCLEDTKVNFCGFANV